MILFSRFLLIQLYQSVEKQISKGVYASSKLVSELESKNWEDRRVLREIIRVIKGISFYWNSLRFIIQKTNRAMQKSVNNPVEEPWFYIITYYKMFDSINYDHLVEQLNKMKEISIKTPIIREFQNRLSKFSWEIALKNKPIVEKLSLQYSIPTFFIETLSSVQNLNEIQELLQKIGQQYESGKLSFRINNLKAHIPLEDLSKKIQSELNEIEIKFEVDKKFNYFFYVDRIDQPALMHTRTYQVSNIILQDKASFMITELLDPQTTEIIWDVCAAPGMKSSAILQKVPEKIKIISTDFNFNRLNSMKLFMRQIIDIKEEMPHLINCDGLHPPFRESYHFDRVLLDAPCTGSGTFSTNPDLKWQQTSEFLNTHKKLQSQLLIQASKKVKNEGILLYSTCSLYCEEGELQIQHFFDYIDKYTEFLFQPIPLGADIGQVYNITNINQNGLGRLSPLRHGTQGFFFGKFKKINKT
jgi:16S rRNA (cytosine967-C5)-methyltransferase